MTTTINTYQCGIVLQDHIIIAVIIIQRCPINCNAVAHGTSRMNHFFYIFCFTCSTFVPAYHYSPGVWQPDRLPGSDWQILNV